jgi:hypothetical protein
LSPEVGLVSGGSLVLRFGPERSMISLPFVELL